MLNAWNLVTVPPKVPKGLIIPVQNELSHAGWETFSLADGKLIMGAGSQYPPGSEGGKPNGSTVAKFQGSAGVGAGGSHTGVSVKTFPTGSADPRPGYKAFYGTWAAGAHTHTLGDVIIDQIDKTGIKLIKSIVAQNTIPPQSVVFSTSSKTSLGMTNVIAHNKALSGHPTTLTFSNSGQVLASSAGNHIHTESYSDQLPQPGGYSMDRWQMNLNSVGLHSSSFPLSTISLNLRRFLLSAWSHAVTSISPTAGMIAMWERTSPPVGWVLCDGNNNTPDLRDCFVYPTTAGSESGEQVGNNTITYGLSGQAQHSFTHHHVSSMDHLYLAIDAYDNTLHTEENWKHTHSVGTSQTSAFLPSYYALSFIQKK